MTDFEESVPFVYPQIPFEVSVAPSELYSSDYSYLTLDELQILGTLDFTNKVHGSENDQSSAYFTFQGIKRKAGLHPQRLSKAIKRLKEKRLIKQSLKQEYVLTESGETMFSKVMKYLRPSLLFPKENYVRTWVSLGVNPFDVELSQIVEELKGKWVGDMRFISYLETEYFCVFDWTDVSGKIHAAILFTSSGDIEVAIVANQEQDAIERRDELMDWLERTLSKHGEVGTRSMGSEMSDQYFSSMKDKIEVYYR